MDWLGNGSKSDAENVDRASRECWVLMGQGFEHADTEQYTTHSGLPVKEKLSASQLDPG